MATYWENSCSFGLRYVSWYKYLIVSLVFSHLGFWSGNLFLIAPFPDLCLLVPFSNHIHEVGNNKMQMVIYFKICFNNIGFGVGKIYLIALCLIPFIVLIHVCICIYYDVCDIIILSLNAGHSERCKILQKYSSQSKPVLFRYVDKIIFCHILMKTK